MITETDIREPETATPEAAAPFFSVSILKLTVMSISTLGLYKLYWFYKNWALIKKREESTIIPFLRAMFPVFFIHRLFLDIREYGEARDIETNLSAGWCAAGCIILAICWRLPDPYSLISFFSIFFLLPVQIYANQINYACAPDQELNDKFTALNWFGIVIGSIVFINLVVTTLLYPNAP